MTADELKAQILAKCDTLQAILAFNYCLYPDDKVRLDATRNSVSGATKRVLRDMHEHVSDNLAIVARQFGSIKKPKEFAAWFIEASFASADVLSVSKAVIDTEFFSSFCDGHQIWKIFPPHLNLCLHFNRVVSKGIPVFDYFLPEAILYEDMALAYNEALAIKSELPTGILNAPNIEVKKLNLRLRTTLLSAFYFLEAYMNGIAFDFHYFNKSSLTAEQEDLLLEWDSSKNKRSFVSLERKIIDYPKLILGSKHPPLTVTNCPSLGILLGNAKFYRDSIVHQSPKIADPSEGAEKVRWLLELRLTHVTEVVDAAVGFVLQLDKVLGRYGFAAAWVHPRSYEPPGQFPDEAFR